ncbi:stereocilin-like [Oncorhynchus tshawytscha]|nr:stereocilin-like [Oncorhynchus tshawytscha]
MAVFRVMRITLLVVLLGNTSTKSSASKKEDQREPIFKELVSIWRKGGGWYPSKEPASPERTQDQQVHSVVRSIMGSLKTLGLLPSKSMGLPSLQKPVDRHRLSGFLYNISMYLQEMGAELEERQLVSDEEQLWEKVLQSFIQSEGGAALNQWDTREPPRPSVRLQDWFLSLRGSPHWDGLLGLLQSLMSLSERQPHRPLLDFLSQNWRTVSALLEAALQALVSGTYGQASAGLQGFICALRGRNECAFSVSWLTQFLRFMETRNWKPVVNVHPAGMGANQRRGSAAFGRLKPFSMPPKALREEGLSGNATQGDVEDRRDMGGDLDSLQTLLLQALSRSDGGQRAGQLAEQNPALLQGLDGLRRGFLHRVGSSVYGNLRRKVSRVTMALLDDVSSVVDVTQSKHKGRCSVGDLRQLILWGIRHNVTWNAQALGFNSQGPPSTPPFLSCPAIEGESGDPRPPQRPSRPRPALSPRRAPKQKQPPTSTPVPRRSRLLKPQSEAVEVGHSHLREMGYFASAEILEAACNASIPGLTGVSNFTVFLYCNLFDGDDGSVDPEVGQVGPDLHATCSDAAWYLSAAEDDFLWVHVCSEFFAHQFNNTVCANTSFWLQRAHQAAEMKDYHYFNQSSIGDLCVQLSGEVVEGGGSPGPDEACLAQLGTRSLSAQDFRRCFLPNTSALVSAMCGSESTEAHPSHPSLPEGSWAAEYCSRLHNSSHPESIEDTCNYRKWSLQHFTNTTLLELCGSTEGLREYVCSNATLSRRLLSAYPQFSDFCVDLDVEQEDRKCFLQWFFDMLPAPYDFDTSQLCVSPAPLLLEALHRLSMCEVDGGERRGWVGAVGYVLRVLDFVVGLSAGLDEGEGEVRQGLGQAILLSSLLDNASFWATLRPNASLSVLQTVGLFLRREQSAALKEDLLSCFSPVLWDLIEREDNSSALRVLMQEYLQMPRESIRTLVMSAEKDAVKRFLSHMHQSWDQLHVETTQRELQAMETMTSAFIHKFPRVTPDLFVDLSQFIPFMSVSDIMSFPSSLMVNTSVLMAIRDHSTEMKSPQKQAFVKRLLQSSVVGDVPSWPPYFLSSILPLLPHLPVSQFQQLTSDQLSPLVEFLGNTSLDGTRGRHVLRTLFIKKRNFTSDNISRLGVLVCYLKPEELRPFLLAAPVSSALWQQLALCVSEGLISDSGKLSLWLVQAVRPLNASTLPPPALATLRGLLPQLGAPFLQSLPSLQLLDLLTQPGLPSFSPAQAFQILSKISQDTNLTMDTLCRLKPLLPGLSPAVLRGIHWSEISGTTHCQCWRTLLADLKPAHRAMLHRALQEALASNSRNFTVQLQCLLPFVPLRELIEVLDKETFLRDMSLYRDLPWSPQQAQLLFKRIHQSEIITRDTVEDLGHIAGGMSCDWLKLWTNETDFSELLQFVSELPGGVRPALRKCIVEELRKRPEEDLDGISPWFAAELPVNLIESLSNTSLTAILAHIQQHFVDFLKLPRHKQMALAEKAITVLSTSQGLAEGELRVASVDLLGPLLPFLDRDTLGLVDREALWLKLDELRGYCLPWDTLKDLAALLTGRDLLGEASAWTVGDVELVGRLLFTLSPKQINSIPLVVLSADTVEEVLAGQWRWENSDVGQACMSQCVDQKGQRERIHSLIRGVVRAQSRRKVPVPSCGDIRGTFPSAWTANQLSRMAGEELRQCVEVIGQDASLSPEQRRALWVKLRQSYSPVRGLRPEQVLGLGCLVTELGERELQDINLTDLGVLAYLGALTDWSPKKMRAAVVGVMRKQKLKVEQLGAVEVASLGHLLCGFTLSEINRLDPYNLSMAALFLRELALPCSEQQMEALTVRLSSPQAFGPVSTWGPEVFTEIGTLAAGLEDMVLSALVQEQMEGLIPDAIALIPPTKMAVVFSAVQLSWLNVEQAWVVTEKQWAELNSGQRHALGLAQYEGDVLLEHRGRNVAPATRSADSLTVCLMSLCCMLWQLSYNTQ